jgi:hypothetical protein
MFNCYYVANNPDRIHFLMEEGAKHILVSYAYARRGAGYLEGIEKGVKNGVKFILDSGAHSNIAHPGSVTLDGYVRWLNEHKELFDEYIVLDDPLETKVTVNHYLKMKESGLSPIVVDHMWFKVHTHAQSWYKDGGRLCWAGFLAGEKTPMGDWHLEKKMPAGYTIQFMTPAQWTAIANRVSERYKLAKVPPLNDIHLLGVGSRLRKFLPYFDVIKSFDAASIFIAGGYGRVMLSREPKAEGMPPRCSGYAVGRGREAPEAVSKLAKQWKLDLDNEVDRRRFNFREMEKYLQSLWEYYKANSRKGYEFLTQMAIAKLDEEDGAFASRYFSVGKVEGITLGKFFPMMKPYRPEYPDQPQTVENFITLFEENEDEWLPTLVQKKYDGCFPYRTKIETNRGSLPIGEIVNARLKVKVKSYNWETKRVEWKPVTNWFTNGSCHEYTSFGCSGENGRRRMLTCTGNHGIYTASGTKQNASDIKANDLVCVRGSVLGKEREDFLRGSLMGDTSLPRQKESQSPYVSISHSIKQQAYLEWKSRLLGVLGGEIKPRISQFGHPGVRWDSRSDVGLLEIWEELHPDGALKKTITKDFLYKLSPVSWAAWIMDDGSIAWNKSPRLLLHTEGFSSKENKLIKNYFCSFGFEVKIYLSRGYEYLAFSSKGTKLILQKCAPWFCEDMAYKLGGTGLNVIGQGWRHAEEPYEGIIPRKVKWSRRVSFSRSKGRFDIEVEGNHNYFVGEILVSNSNHQAHKWDGKVRIFSEDGTDNTDRLPNVVKELLALPVDPLVVPMEIEAWEGSQHMPREVASGYIHSTGAPDDSNLVCNIYDVLWYGKEGDIHVKEAAYRLGLLSKLGVKQGTKGAPDLRYCLNVAPFVVVDNTRDLERVVREYRTLPGSEGVVCKQVDAPYLLALTHPDYQIKYHNATVFTAVILGKKKTAGGAWAYQYGVLPGREKPATIVQVKEQDVVPMGDTFTTSLDLEMGDLLRIEGETINLTRSPQGIDISAWVPRVLSEGHGGANTVDEVVTQARRDLVLQEKDVDVKGNVSYRPTGQGVRKSRTVAELLVEAGPPNEWSGAVAAFLGSEGRKKVKTLWEALSERDKRKVKEAFEQRWESDDVAMELEHSYPDLAKGLAKQQDPYLEVPPEDGAYRYVVQNHFRGASVHNDLRIEMRPKDLLAGWTLNTQIPGNPDRPILSLADARRWIAEDGKQKINWKTGEWATRPKGGTDKLVRAEIQSERKAPEPYAWIDVEGKTKDPQPGQPPPVGGTRQYPGVFLILDQGTVEYGAQKSWFHEYFFHGKALNYRMFFRELAFNSANKGECCETHPESEATVAIGWAEGDKALLCLDCAKELLKKADVVLPPSEDQGMGDEAAWLAIYPDDPTPYVLGKEAVDKKWMPPDGYSALPKAVRVQVPKGFQYWDKRGQEALAMRDALVDAIAKGEVKLDFEAPYKRAQKSLLDAEFVLQDQTWRGPIQIRLGPSRRRWFIRVDLGVGDLLVFEMPQDPLSNEQISTMVSHDGHRDSMGIEGVVKPGHYLNPTKETPSFVDAVDRGRAEILSQSDTFIKARFHGKKLKGVYTLTRNAQSNQWLWAPSQEAPEVQSAEKRYDFEIFVPVYRVELRKGADGQEKRLVTGVVLEPNVIDAQHDYEEPETIERAAHKFLMNYNKPVGQNGTQLGLMHRAFGDLGIELVESYVAPAEFALGNEKVKKGSWIMTVHVTSDKVWSDVKAGKLTGFSIGGVATIAS